MKLKSVIAIFLISLITTSNIARAQSPTGQSSAAQPSVAQSPVVTLPLNSDQIGLVRTAVQITTRVSFSEPVAEIICGDLYDPGSGKGTFVVQRSGSNEKPGNDVFIKPVVSKGQSNMFVRTGDGRHTYNFDLKIVSPEQAHRVVNVTDVVPAANPPSEKNNTQPADPAPETVKIAPCPDADRIKSEAEQAARVKADEITRNARQQADRITGEAEAKLAEANRRASDVASQESDRRFMQALMLGLRETKINSPRVTTKKKIIVVLDPRVLLFDEKAYLRYTIQNAGELDFTFTSISLEMGTGAESRPLTIQIKQTKDDNRLASGESLTGIIAYDPAQVTPKDKLTLFVRGEDSTEITHVTIQGP
ncbi:MAG TPA: hypothetical protein VJX74_09720 [Blastocatellia bacterium]|nr:hypothetical protein [Blastocatellia bacterium]